MKSVSPIEHRHGPPLRPAPEEYPPSFAGYVGRIADDEDITAALAHDLSHIASRFAAIPETRGDYRYAPGKWSIKEVIGHLCDTERVFACRALRISRGDVTPLASFDDGTYVAAMLAGERTLTNLVDEWEAVRRASVALFSNLPAAAWSRRGVAGDNAISVRALAYVVTGHARHHLELLDARYGR